MVKIPFYLSVGGIVAQHGMYICSAKQQNKNSYYDKPTIETKTFL